MGLSLLKGNGGFLGVDKRTINTDLTYDGNFSLKKTYLERLNGNLQPVSPPAVKTLNWDAAIIASLDPGPEVAQWDSQTTNTLSFTSTGFDQPGWSSSNSALNNLASVNCLSGDFMDTANDTDLDVNGTGGFTVYIVGRLVSYLTTNAILLVRSNHPTLSQGWGIYGGSGRQTMRFFVNDYVTNYAEISFSDTTNAHIFKMVYDQNNIKAEIIGPSSGSDSVAYSTPVTDPTGIGLHLGESTTGTNDISFQYGEIVYYNFPLVLSQQLAIEDELKTKFNIS